MGVETGTVSVVEPFVWPKAFGVRRGQKNAPVQKLVLAADIVENEPVGRAASEGTAVDKLCYMGSHSMAMVGLAKVGAHSMEMRWCGRSAEVDVGRHVI